MAVQSNHVEGASSGYRHLHPVKPQTVGLRPTERLFIEKTLLKIYPRLQRHDLFPWNLINGPLIPDFLVKHTNPRLRRIVVVGCGDGVLCNTLSLLFPEIEIVGIDANASHIATARSTVGHRQNLKFICGNAATMLDIPCDRIIYDHCLNQLKDSTAFKKLLAKTLRWVVDSGDFIIREAPIRLLKYPSLIKEFWPQIREHRQLEAGLDQVLQDLGYHQTQAVRCSKIPGLPTEVYLRNTKNPNENMALPAAQTTVSEWHDYGDQSTHSVLGFLFGNQQADFRQELH